MKRLILLLLLLIPAGIRAQEDQLPLYALPDPARFSPVNSATMALTSDGRVVVTNMLSDTVGIVDPQAGQLLSEIPAGYEPRGLALSADGDLLVVASRGDHALTVIDLQNEQILRTIDLESAPVSIVLGPEGLAYVALSDADMVAVVNIEAGRIVARISTPPQPYGLTLWGDFLYVTHFWQGFISMIYLPESVLVRTVVLGPEAGWVPGLSINARAGVAYVPYTLRNPDPAGGSRYNEIVPAVLTLDLATLRVVHEARILPGIASGAMSSAPYALLLERGGGRLYLADSGSDRVDLIDLETGLAEASFETGANPRGLIFSRNEQAVYVHDAVDQTLSIAPISFFNPVDRIPTSEIAPEPEMLIGARLFYRGTDPRLSDTGLSCASCHFDGGGDDLPWNLAPLDELTLPNLDAHLRMAMGGSGLLPDARFDLAALLDYWAGLRESGIKP